MTRKQPCTDHTWRCTDSRMHEGYRRRRYKCINKGCEARQSTVEILMENTDIDLRTSNYHGRLAAALTDAQARSLLEQFQAGHKTLNLI